MPSSLRGAVDAAQRLGFRRAAGAKAEGNVVPDVHIGIKRVVLEHHRDVAIARAHVIHLPAVDLDRALLDVLEAGDGPEQGRLAAAGGTDQHGELARRDLEIDAAQHLDRSEALVQSTNGQLGHGRLTP